MNNVRRSSFQGDDQKWLTMYPERAKSVDVKAKKVVLTSGIELNFIKLILCTGAVPRQRLLIFMLIIFSNFLRKPDAEHYQQLRLRVIV